MTGGVTGAILCGGDSRRMGADKAALRWRGRPLLGHVHGVIAPLCDEVLVVCRPGQEDHRAALAPAGCRVVADRHRARGPLVGIEAALAAAAQPRVLAVACDMPWLARPLLAAMLAEGRGDVVVPGDARGFEPLHAIYHRRCLPAVQAALAAGSRPVAAFFDAVGVDVWSPERCRRHDPAGRSLHGVNRPADLAG
jgi:molybdopterin-guanine dinucleotide biosynthesis protein A